MNKSQSIKNTYDNNTHDNDTHDNQPNTPYHLKSQTFCKYDAFTGKLTLRSHIVPALLLCFYYFPS